MTTTTTRAPGAAIRADDPDARSEAARLMGQSTSERKVAAVRENARKASAARTGKPMSEEHKAKISAARLAQEAARKQDAPSLVQAQASRGVGRPRTRPLEEPGEKRGRGRPKKQTQQETQETQQQGMQEGSAA